VLIYQLSRVITVSDELQKRERMKTLIASLALAAITASSASAALTEEQAHIFCPSVEGLAAAIMTARQGGHSMSAIRAVMQNVDGNSAGFVQDMAQMLVSIAYKEPQWHTESSRQDAINRFSVEAGIMCWEAVE
jgi:hypothetical protein